jgi:hypothetical protein
MTDVPDRSDYPLKETWMKYFRFRQQLAEGIREAKLKIDKKKWSFRLRQ